MVKNYIGNLTDSVTSEDFLQQSGVLQKMVPKKDTKAAQQLQGLVNISRSNLIRASFLLLSAKASLVPSSDYFSISSTDRHRPLSRNPPLLRPPLQKPQEEIIFGELVDDSGDEQHYMKQNVLGRSSS